MKDKNKALKLIKDAIITEEDAIPIYGRHLDTAIFWSGIDKQKEELIRRYMDILMNDTRKHILMFSEVKRMIEEEENV